MGLYFDPHTSYEVWLAKKYLYTQFTFILIHTPLTRCDLLFQFFFCLDKDFDPHTSYEVWLAFVIVSIMLSKILIHTPLTRCDLQWQHLRKRCWNILIHTPLTRCDMLMQRAQQRTCLFWSTHLLRGVTETKEYKVYNYTILIHTPLTRCDK